MKLIISDRSNTDIAALSPGAVCWRYDMTEITGLDKQMAMLALAVDRSMSRAAIAVGCVLLT